MNTVSYIPDHTTWPAVKLGVSPQLVWELVLANRILERKGVLDTFGHVSVRLTLPSSSNSPDHQPLDVYLQSVYSSPSLVLPQLIHVFSVSTSAPLSSPHPLTPGPIKPSLETHIHAGIFRKRQDVRAVLHCHSGELVTWGIVGTRGRIPATGNDGEGVEYSTMKPVGHVSALLGPDIPIFDLSRQPSLQNQPTNLLINTPSLGDLLAKSLPKPIMTILMRGHGATFCSDAGFSPQNQDGIEDFEQNPSLAIKDIVHRGFYGVQNARIQKDALLISSALRSAHEPLADSSYRTFKENDPMRGEDKGIVPLMKGEIEMMTSREGDVSAVERSWPAWVDEVVRDKGEWAIGDRKYGGVKYHVL